MQSRLGLEFKVSDITWEERLSKLRKRDTKEPSLRTQDLAEANPAQATRLLELSTHLQENLIE